MREFMERINKLIYFNGKNLEIDFEKFYEIIKEYDLSYEEYELVIMNLSEKNIYFKHSGKSINSKQMLYNTDSTHIPNTDFFTEYEYYIRNYPLLSRQEEKQLFIKVSNGDLDAFSKIFNSNLRLVRKIARRYSKFGYDLADLIQEGNLGLMEAIERFDYDKYNYFSTYEYELIRGAILNSISAWHNIPHYVFWNMIKIYEAKEELLSGSEKVKTSQISELVNLQEEEVEKYLELMHEETPLDEFLLQEEEKNTYYYPEYFLDIESKILNDDLICLIKEYFWLQLKDLVLDYKVKDLKNIMKFCRKYSKKKNVIDSTIKSIKTNTHIYNYLRNKIKTEGPKNILYRISPVLYDDMYNKIIESYIEGYKKQYPFEYKCFEQQKEYIKTYYNDNIKIINDDEELIRLKEKLPHKKDSMEDTMELYAALYQTIRSIDIFVKRVCSGNKIKLQELGDYYGITRERTRAIEKEALIDIQNYFNNIEDEKVKLMINQRK